MSEATPQLIVSLDAEGKLCINLPGSSALPRQVKADDEYFGTLCRRVLEAQAEAMARAPKATPANWIGTEAAPTAAQVKHWEDHALWGDPRCAFCQAEGRYEADGSPKARRPARRFVDRGDGIEVRKIPFGASGLGPDGKPKPKPSGKTAEEMGL